MKYLGIPASLMPVYWSACLLLLTPPAFSQGKTVAKAEPVNFGTYFVNGLQSGDGASKTDARHAAWYIFEAKEDGFINISSCEGGSDTRLWVYKGLSGELSPIAFSDDACDIDTIPFNQNNFAASVDYLPVEAGTTYYLEWDDHWDRSPFFWSITPTQQLFDLRLRPAVFFHQVPRSQAGAEYALSVEVVNAGVTTAKDIPLSLEIFQTAPEAPGFPLSKFQKILPELQADSSVVLELGSLDGLPEGAFQLRFKLDGLADDVPENNLLDQSINITPSVYALDKGLTDVLGAPVNGQLAQGQVFPFVVKDSIYSVSTYIAGGAAKDELFVEVYEFQGERPLNLLRRSASLNLEAPGPGWLNFEFIGGPVVVEKDKKYLFALVQEGTGTNIQLGVSNSNFQEKQAWFRSKAIAESQGNWVPVETIQQEVTYLIRLIHRPLRSPVRFRVDSRRVEQAFSRISLLFQQDAVGTQIAEAVEVSPDTWEVEIEAIPEDSLRYLFFLDDLDNGLEEQLPETCSFSGRDLPPHRRVWVPLTDLNIPLVCFGRCTDCRSDDNACATPEALICDDFDQYPVESALSLNAPWWKTRSLLQDGIIDTSNSFSPTQSAHFLKGARPLSGLDIHHPDNGVYLLEWQMLIPKDHSGAFVLSSDSIPSDQGAFELLFASDAQRRLNQGGKGLLLPQGTVFSYPESKWFRISQLIDFRERRIRWTVNDNLVNESRFVKRPRLVNFFSPNNNSNFYLDDVRFIRKSACDQDAYSCEGFEWYPPGNLQDPSGLTWWNPQNQASGSVGFDQVFRGDQALAISPKPELPPTLLVPFRAADHFQFSWHMYFPSEGQGDIQFKTAGSTDAQLFQIQLNRSPGKGSINGFPFELPLDQWVEMQVAIAGNLLFPRINDSILLLALEIPQRPEQILFDQAGEGETAFYIDELQFSPLSTTSGPVEILVDASLEEALHPDGIFIAGNFTQGLPVPMQQVNATKFSYVLPLHAGDTLVYQLFNGPEEEAGPSLDSCLSARLNETPARSLIAAPYSREELCFNHCVACASVEPVSVDRPDWYPDVRLFPNPTADRISIQLPEHLSENIQWTLFDPLGRPVQLPANKDQWNSMEISLKKFPPGLYLLQIRYDNERGEWKILKH